jgi:hypothetical protein
MAAADERQGAVFQLGGWVKNEFVTENTLGPRTWTNQIPAELIRAGDEALQAHWANGTRGTDQNKNIDRIIAATTIAI